MKQRIAFQVVLLCLGLSALAGTAAATSVTTTTGGAATTPTFHFVPDAGHSRIANPIATIECFSTIEGKVESHGAGVTAKGNISRLEFTGCTNSWHVTAETKGSLEVHWENGHNGILTSSGALVDATRFGITCKYETNNTQIGTVTGGNPATLIIEASLPIAAGSSGLCGSGNAKWQASYVTTSALYVTK